MVEIPLINYARVTEVLQRFCDFSHIDAAVLARAADRGTRVHKFCEWYSKNILIEEPDTDCKNYVDSFIEWSDANILQVIKCEETIYSDSLKLRGTIDLIARVKGYDGLCIIDLKTPQTCANTWPIQTAAYQLLAEKELKVNCNHRFCLMLSKNGYIAKPIEYQDHEGNRSTFLKMLDLYYDYMALDRQAQALRQAIET